MSIINFYLGASFKIQNAHFWDFQNIFNTTFRSTRRCPGRFFITLYSSSQTTTPSPTPTYSYFIFFNIKCKLSSVHQNYAFTGGKRGREVVYRNFMYILTFLFSLSLPTCTNTIFNKTHHVCFVEIAPGVPQFSRNIICMCIFTRLVLYIKIYNFI